MTIPCQACGNEAHLDLECRECWKSVIVCTDCAHATVLCESCGAGDDYTPSKEELRAEAQLDLVRGQ